MSSETFRTMTALLARRDPAAAAWLETQTAPPPLPGTPAFARAFARAGRRLPGPPPPGDAEPLRALGIVAPEAWPAAWVPRAALLVAAVAEAGDDAPARLTAAFQTSDNGERAVMLQALPLLPEPARFVAIAVDACRTSVQPVFEAIACHNAYPAAHFSEPAFNQMVLKAVFTGAPLAHVSGLAGRLTPALRRMAADFRAERLAAGRPVPADLNLLLDLEPGA